MKTNSEIKQLMNKKHKIEKTISEIEETIHKLIKTQIELQNTLNIATNKLASMILGRELKIEPQ